MTDRVTSPLAALTTGLIDYAGLFPPASLSLPAAVAEFRAHRQQPEAWMLSHFILPATHLPDFSPLLADFTAAELPVPVSLLGRGGDSADDFSANLAADLALLADHATPAIAAELFEVRLPNPHLLTDLPTLLADLSAALAAHGLAGFVEVPFDITDWAETVTTVAQALAAHNAAHPARPLGFKLRTGGLEASAFPSPAQVAHAITTARDHRLLMKATAGLHHPFRHFALSVNTEMHGFINVFAAGVFAHALGLNAAALEPILADTNPNHFTLTNAGLTYAAPGVYYQASHAQIAASRAALMRSYGSCSFNEPRADLQAIGWL